MCIFAILRPLSVILCKPQHVICAVALGHRVVHSITRHTHNVSPRALSSRLSWRANKALGVGEKSSAVLTQSPDECGSSSLNHHQPVLRGGQRFPSDQGGHPGPASDRERSERQREEGPQRNFGPLRSPLMDRPHLCSWMAWSSRAPISAPISLQALSALGAVCTRWTRGTLKRRTEVGSPW